MRKRISILCIIAGFGLLVSCSDNPGLRVVKFENMIIVHHVDSVKVSGTVIRGKITNDGRDTTYTDTTHVHNLVVTHSEFQKEAGKVWADMLTDILWYQAFEWMDKPETKTDKKDDKKN